MRPKKQHCWDADLFRERLYTPSSEFDETFGKNDKPLGRLAKPTRRVVGAFPDGQSCLNLAGSKWSTRKYMNIASRNAKLNVTNGAMTG